MRPCSLHLPIQKFKALCLSLLTALDVFTGCVYVGIDGGSSVENAHPLLLGQVISLVGLSTLLAG